VALALPATAEARAHAQPDLRVASVTVSARTVAAGGELTIRDRTVNDGPGSAGPSVTGYYLGSSAQRHRGDVRLGRHGVASLAAGDVARSSRTVTIPADARAGRYRILACADDRHKVDEKAEHNNCKAASAALTVTAPAGPPGPDTTPPVFAGLDATTVTSQSTVRLSWSPGSDDRTPASALVYDVYMATTAGGENYGSPTASSGPGMTSIEITVLNPLTPYYFVVLARDQAGNSSVSKVERSVTIGDITPPTFAGITSAIQGGACCNGPVLSWTAASDNVTPAAEIVYDIYAASSKGQENFSVPTFTSAPGATSYQVPLGASAGPYWVVRARDAAGNRDANTREEKTQLTP
jgi:hypothetical protein